MIDLIYLTHNRLEFTKASLAALFQNTDWRLVNQFWFFDEGSTDGTKEFLKQIVDTRIVPGTKIRAHVGPMFLADYSGGPVTAMNDWLDEPGAPVFAKIDNDVIVPPGWLGPCVEVMECFPRLSLLGIEPPLSRTPAPWTLRKPVLKPEYGEAGVIHVHVDQKIRKHSFAECEAIGGIGLMRREAFGKARMTPHHVYGGFTDWQLQHPEIRKGWMLPSVKLFLLDRLPIEPWATLSKEYIAKGWQRPWTNYDPKDAEKLWGWWL